MRVIIAEDAVLFRAGVVRVLTDAGCTVVAEAGDAPTLLAAAARHPADVAIVDIRMPPTHTIEGLDAARALRAEHPGLGVLILSAYLEPHYAMTLLEHGVRAAGYLLKDRVTDLEEFVAAVRRVAAGGLVIDPSVVAQLLGRRRRRDPLAGLTGRERDVLALMAEGRSNQAVAARLHLSPKTVEAHVRSLFGKLGLEETADDNRRVLAVLAFLRSADPAAQVAS
ncbi:response regulator transcription factor [Actinoplanes sp. DH11]|uniref:response regulator transcription factor n=1 Tax=Actinoplanes sp. DH11 TaxID=2857011 RepID=UPI001E46C473|nr:response regulator transcription factor [Actinoplanes sp. DH11]